MEEAEALETAARAAIADMRLDGALDQLGRALALREEAAGPDDPEIIWTLSLMIEALRWRHTPRDAAEAAAFGERRLALRRAALAAAPEELARSLRELARLYVFEDDPFDPRRIAALEREAAALDPGGA